MNKKITFLLCAIFLCSTLSWGQTWRLSPTMTAELNKGTLTVSTTKSAEAMPNYDMHDNLPPWNANDILKAIIKNNVTSIGNGAFMDCVNLTSITIPSSVKSIGSESFLSCNKLTSITIPDSVTTIGRNAFYGCGITSITIPNSVTKIGESAFELCFNLKTITVGWLTPLNIPGNVFANTASNIKLYVPIDTKISYQEKDVWKSFETTIEKKSTLADLRISGEFLSELPRILDRFSDYLKETIGLKKMAWCILILSVILFFIRIAKEDEGGDEPRRGVAYFINTTLLLTVCVIEIMFSLSMDSGIPWFCDPSEVGWLWAVVNFLLLGGILYNQILCLFEVLGDVFANGNAGCDLTLGYFSWIGFFICVILCDWFFQKAVPWVFLALAIMQTIQLILIFWSYGKNISGAFWCVFVYLLGTLGTAATLKVFIGLLILALIGYAILGAVLNSDSKSKSSSSSNSTSGELCRTCTYYPGYGRNCNYNGRSTTVDDNTSACSRWQRG